jgi:tetratricopeptide (TPR) repeat protein
MARKIRKKKYKIKLSRFFFVIGFIVLFVFAFIWFKSYVIKKLSYKENEKNYVLLLQKGGSTKAMYKIANKFLEKYPNSLYIGYAYFYIGKYFYEKEEYKKSVKYFQEALKNYLDEDKKILVFLHLSYDYLYLGDILASMEFAQKIYDILEKGKMKALASYQLAICYRVFKLYDKSLYYLDKALSFTDDRDIIMRVEKEKLSIYKKIDLKKAKKYEIILKEKYKGKFK